MKKYHLNNIKRDALLAILIPSVIMLSFQVAFYAASLWAICAVVLVGGFCLFQYVYKFVQKLNDKTWIQQLYHVIENVSSPVIIADLNYQISFANKSFNKLPLAVLRDNVDNLLDFISTQDNKLNASIKNTLDGLKGKVRCHLNWGDRRYVCMLTPLNAPMGERWGILLECHPIENQEYTSQYSAKSFGTLDQAHASPSFVHFENIDEDKNDIILKAVQQTSHPLLILDELHVIKQVNHNFAQLFADSDKTIDTNELVGMNILECINEHAPNLKSSLVNALDQRISTTFIGEHFNKICDWVITPIQSDENILGTVIEILYPSKQEMIALEENVARVEKSKNELEKELRQFTQGLANCKLYQKGNEALLEGINAQDYSHPLIRNSSKIIYQLYSDLHQLHNEVEIARSSIEKNHQVDVNAYALPLKQVNMLSNALSRNVYETEHDLAALHQEVSKLKGLLGEQKGLNQAYMKPLSRALTATEQALHKTVNHAETVTLVVQQIHENQIFIGQLQEFILKLSKLPQNSESQQTSEIYKEIIGLLEKVKTALAAGKLKLKELLINFDSLNTCWKQAQENLQACLHSGTSIDQASKRCSTMSNTAHDYSQLIQEKIAQLIEIAQLIQEKTTTVEIIVETAGHKASTGRQFDKLVIEVDETKKKAEEVLLEGLTKY